jgi:hypothetical protein
VVSYPLNESPVEFNDYSAAPDDRLFVALAYRYARAHRSMWRTGRRCNTTNGNYANFLHGITNGAAWYHMTGGMQVNNAAVQRNVFSVSYYKSQGFLFLVTAFWAF